MLKIVKFPSDILRERMPEFEFNNPIMDPVRLEKDMIEFITEGFLQIFTNPINPAAKIYLVLVGEISNKQIKSVNNIYPKNSLKKPY